MVHAAVRGVAAAEVMAFHKAGKSPALADSNHVHLVERLELIYQNAIAEFQVAVATLKPKLLQISRAFDVRFLQMAALGLVDARGFDVLQQSKLNRVVAI